MFIKSFATCSDVRTSSLVASCTPSVAIRMSCGIVESPSDRKHVFVFIFMSSSYLSLQNYDERKSTCKFLGEKKLTLCLHFLEKSHHKNMIINKIKKKLTLCLHFSTILSLQSTEYQKNKENVFLSTHPHKKICSDGRKSFLSSNY